MTSVSQGCYILTFFDEFLRFTWVYFFHHKNEVVHKLQAFKSHGKHKSRKTIKLLRVDNENRYVDHRLRDFCKHKGIDLQNPAPFSLHKIDIATLRIHTLKTMVSCIIQAKSLDTTLEVKAIISKTHILNRFPHISLDRKTPFKAWCRKKLVVSHFRVFNCPAWENLSSRGCKAPTPRPCTLIGYDKNVKAY